MPPARSAPPARTHCVDESSTFHRIAWWLRHEVARLIVWQVVSTRPVVPSTVSYADVREGNDPYSACGHGTHSHLTGTRTVRGRCLGEHQAEMGLDGWDGGKAGDEEKALKS